MSYVPVLGIPLQLGTLYTFAPLNPSSALLMVARGTRREKPRAHKTQTTASSFAGAYANWCRQQKQYSQVECVEFTQIVAAVAAGAAAAAIAAPGGGGGGLNRGDYFGLFLVRCPLSPAWTCVFQPLSPCCFVPYAWGVRMIPRYRGGRL